MDFKGTEAELKAHVSNSGFTGQWSQEGDKLVFRASGGAVLNWWPNSKKKTLSVQGGPAA